MNKSIEQYMNLKTAHETFVPTLSKAIGKSIGWLEKEYGVKIRHIHNSPEDIENEHKPEPEIKVGIGMSLYIVGVRKNIKTLCEKLNLP